jgi:uncharacterized protein involved in exopolysaccharide biosynthesis
MASRVFRIEFQYPDPKKAQDTVNALIARFLKEATAGYSLDLLDAPGLPKRPAIPNRAALAITGGVAGLILALFVLLIRGRRKPGLQTA